MYIDDDNFTQVNSFSYSTEGWGLTHNDTSLIMSDGTSRIYYLDTETYAEIGHIDVTAEGSPVENLNELEYIQGRIYAKYEQNIGMLTPIISDKIADAIASHGEPVAALAAIG